MDVNDITEQIIGAAISVHREGGPGLQESIYAECMALELRARRLNIEQQVPMSLVYRGSRLESIYRIDLIVEHKVVVELKSVSSLDAIFTAQVLTYLRLTGCPIGLLINFKVPLLKDGIRRLIYNLHSSSETSAALR